MTKRKQQEERRHGAKHATILLYAILTTVVTSLAFGGWYARSFVAEELASKSEVIVAGTQAQAALDIQMEQLIARIARLETKRNKNADEQAQLAYLRNELKRLRQLRSLR